MNVDIYLCGVLTRWPKSGMGSQSSSTFSRLLGNLLADLHHGSHQQWISFLFDHIFTAICYHCLFVFLMITILAEGRWTLKAVFKCCVCVCHSAHSDTSQASVLSFHHGSPGIEFQGSGSAVNPFTLQAVSAALKEVYFYFSGSQGYWTLFPRVVISSSYFFFWEPTVEFISSFIDWKIWSVWFL